MATPISTSTYNQLNSAIQDILRSGVMPVITIYTDAAATNIVVDAHGNIENRRVQSVSFTDSYKDENGNPTEPFVTINFTDGINFIDTFKTIDNVDDHWFTLSTIPVPYTKFGSN
jgi:transposase-like protein